MSKAKSLLKAACRSVEYSRYGSAIANTTKALREADGPAIHAEISKLHGMLKDFTDVQCGFEQVNHFSEKDIIEEAEHLARKYA